MIRSSSNDNNRLSYSFHPDPIISTANQPKSTTNVENRRLSKWSCSKTKPDVSGPKRVNVSAFSESAGLFALGLAPKASDQRQMIGWAFREWGVWVFPCWDIHTILLFFIDMGYNYQLNQIQTRESQCSQINIHPPTLTWIIMQCNATRK